MSAICHIKVIGLVSVVSLRILQPLANPVLAQNGSDKSSQNPCKVADTFFSLKLYNLAQKEYKSLPANTSNSNCQKIGLEKISAIKNQSNLYYEIGLTYSEADQWDKALKAYLKALSINPDSQKAKTKLEEVLKEYKFIPIQTLAEKGEYTEAQASLSQLKKENPQISKSIPEDIAYLDKRPVSQWLTIRKKFEDKHLWIEPLVLLISLPFLYLFLRWRLWIWISGLCSLRLEIQDFENGLDEELKLGKGVSALVREAFSNCNTQVYKHRIDLVVNSLESFELAAELANINPSLKILNQVISQVAPPNSLCLSGCLQTSQKNGAGLTLILTEKRTGRIFKTTTIWQNMYGDFQATENLSELDDYLFLAQIAASNWLIYSIKEYQERNLFSSLHKRWAAFSSRSDTH